MLHYFVKSSKNHPVINVIINFLCGLFEKSHPKLPQITGGGQEVFNSNHRISSMQFLALQRI
jgi:hypothetical protein